MKKLSFLFMFAIMATLSFTACSDDDDNVDQKTDSVVGTWTYAKTITDVKTNSLKNDSIISNDIIKMMDTDLKNSSAAFYADGSYKFGLTGNDTILEEGSYKQEGKVITTTSKDDEEETGYKTTNYILENNNLILSDSFTEEYNEMELNELLSLGVTGIKDNTYKVEKANFSIYLKR